MPAPSPFAGDRRAARRRRGASARRAGRRSEWLCALWLLAKGYRLLGFRLKTPFAEIDILARKGGTVAVIEIKRRANLAEALAAVTPTQRNRLRRAALFLLRRQPAGASAAIRLDLIALAPGRWPRHVRGAWGES